MAFLLMRSNLQDRRQRVKINTTSSSQTRYIKEFYKDQFLVLYYLIFINDIFYALKGIDICNFADGITPYACDSNVKSVLETLEHNSELAVAWFEMNYVKLNTDKCHLLGQMQARLDRDIVCESNETKLLGVTLNNKLKFGKHMSKS